MGWIRDRQVMRCSQIFLRWVFLHKAVTGICPWQSSLPRGSCLCVQVPFLLVAASASGTCCKPLEGGGSLLWTLVQRRCWALQAAVIYSFEVASIPLTRENISSLDLSLSQEWEGVADKAQGQRRVSCLRHQVLWEGAGFWHCRLYHRVPAWGCHFVASCSNPGTCLVFCISKSTPGATWSFKASFRWFALRNSIKGTTTIKR